MSVNEIVKYVRQTPGNTNPAMVKSMIESELKEDENSPGWHFFFFCSGR